MDIFLKCNVFVFSLGEFDFDVFWAGNFVEVDIVGGLDGLPGGLAAEMEEVHLTHPLVGGDGAVLDSHRGQAVGFQLLADGFGSDLRAGIHQVVALGGEVPGAAFQPQLKVVEGIVGTLYQHGSEVGEMAVLVADDAEGGGVLVVAVLLAAVVEEDVAAIAVDVESVEVAVAKHHVVHIIGAEHAPGSTGVEVVELRVEAVVHQYAVARVVGAGIGALDADGVEIGHVAMVDAHDAVVHQRAGGGDDADVADFGRHKVLDVYQIGAVCGKAVADEGEVAEVEPGAIHFVADNLAAGLRVVGEIGCCGGVGTMAVG